MMTDPVIFVAYMAHLLYIYKRESFFFGGVFDIFIDCLFFRQKIPYAYFLISQPGLPFFIYKLDRLPNIITLFMSLKVLYQSIYIIEHIK